MTNTERAADPRTPGQSPSLEMRLDTIEQLAHIGSLQWDLQRDRVVWSEQLSRILGVDPDPTSSSMRYFLDHFVDEGRAAMESAIREMRETGEPFDVRERIQRPDGEVRYLRTHGSLVTEDGSPRHLVIVCEDQTRAMRDEQREEELALERARRMLAEIQRERASFIAEATAILSSSLDYEETLTRLANVAVPRIADWCAVDILTREGTVERLAVAHPDPEMEELAREMQRRYPPDMDASTGMPNVIRTGRPELVAQLPRELILTADIEEEQREMLLRLNLHSYMIVPLTVRNNVLGALTLVSAESRVEFDEEDLRFAEELAGRAAYAVENSRLYRDSRRAEQQLRDREQQFRFLADSIPVQVWTATPQGQLDYVNRQTEQYFGEPAENLVGDGWAQFLNPDQVPDIIAAWTHSLTTGEPYQVEFLLRNGAGEYRWHLARARPRTSEDGTIERWFGTNTDVHEAREAEAERQRLVSEKETERKRLLDVFEQAPALIATLSGPDHVFETANPAYLEIVGRDDIIGRTVAEALPEVVEQGFIDLLDRVYLTGEAFIGNELPVTLSGSGDEEPAELRINFLYQPMLRADGSVSGIFIHGTDVTDLVRGRNEVADKADELARTARQLQATNQELDQFAYVASHDLKAPLRGIANLSQWIEEDLTGEVNAEVKEHLDLMRGRVLRMEGLIDGILEYSRAGRTHEPSAPVDVHELVESTIDLLAPEEVMVEIEGSLPTLTTEALPLRQVFMNLISNAIKFVPKDGEGRVTVSADDAGAFYQFTVADNGPGIDPAYHDRIFVIFQTLNARDDVEGTGIGLSLVKKIVENRGGQVRVESEEGSGAKFHFLWPRIS